MGNFFVLIGFIGFCWGIGGLIKSFHKKKTRKRPLLILGAAFIVMAIGFANVQPSNNASSSEVKIQSEKKVETKKEKQGNKRKTQEEKQKQEDEQKDQEEKQKQEDERKAQEEKQKQEDERKAQEEKQKQEDERKAQEEKQKQEEINQRTVDATNKLAQAEASPTNENYQAALTAIQAIPNGNQDLSNRLVVVDSTIKANEAAEQQRQQQAAAQAQQQAAAEAQQQAAQQAAQQAQQQNNEQVVYIAPDHGTKYHLNPNCSGLNNANSVVPMPLSEALAKGYTLCKRG
ncbi:hypothetical protein [Enterococcus durans]|uniref:hypothetical protein n=1 Tax=Enterococcus durans TaxID=53345 RepID=UPI0009C1649B|nr:hypothetical protein [Enterococcus durans]ASV96514.1 hypothetical protein CJZ72_13700 [Enterococcus durans]MBX9040576.1 hypothetical protein [Enterococcus durans]MBX9077242.1 hypothetical protein [Enterococcus durans]MDT2774106.1 hypothetical protein [Enterococcus durans]OQO77955.1 hypothetical protein BH742_13215 [Enterococcus durans]